LEPESRHRRCAVFGEDPDNGTAGDGVSMVRDGTGRAGARRVWVRSVAGAASALALLLAGCATESQHRVHGATVAFESIDGPPRALFDRLVARLDAEARTRQVAVVSRAAPARYRIRAYLAAKVERRRTAVSWVWDIYDSDLRRAVRIAGEETVDRAAPDAWTTVDERMLARIAEAGMTKLAAFAAGPGGASPEVYQEQPAPQPADPPAMGPGDIRVAVAAAAR
jgi:hypothetical protein